MQLIPLEKIHSSRDSVRKARESQLIDKDMTLEPHGLNGRDELLGLEVLHTFSSLGGIVDSNIGIRKVINKNITV